MDSPLTDMFLLSAAAADGRPWFSRTRAGDYRRRKRKLVVFHRGMGGNSCHSVLSECALRPLKHLPLANAIAVEVDEDDEITHSRLRSHRAVRRIDDDIIVQIAPYWFAQGPLAQDRRHYTQIPSWGWEKIGAEVARNRQLQPVKIAVIDTGIAYNHPDLQGKVAGGVNTIDSNLGFNDDNGHGTHVAGIIGALDNNIGVIGVAPNVELYAVKVLDDSGSGNLSDLIEGLQWCIDNGIHLVNMSLSSQETNDTFREVVSEVNRRGVTMVCAAGNGGPEGGIDYPSRYPEPISVAATTVDDTIAEFSSRGPEVDIAAPGDDIASTWLRGGYKSLSGTSMATPFVTGAAALIMGSLGDVSPSRVRSLLNRCTVSLQQISREAQGSGRIDITRLSRLLWSNPASRWYFFR